jgi:hypothetical protein
MAKEVSIADYERMQAAGIHPTSEAEIEAALNGDPEQHHVEALDMLEIPYEFGGIEFAPIKGTALLFALDAIHSPFLDPDASEAGLMDVATAVYCIGTGREAVTPVLQLDRRRSALKESEILAATNPALFDRYLARRDAIERDAVCFEQVVMGFWDQLEGVTLDDATQFVFSVVQNACGGFGMLPPAPDGDDSKKNG